MQHTAVKRKFIRDLLRDADSEEGGQVREGESRRG